MVNAFDYGSRGSFHFLRNALRAWTSAASEPIETVRLATKVGLRSGLTFEITPRGLISLLRARGGGGLGVAALFRVHAATRPDAIAILDGSTRLSYRELDARIDRLASRMRHELGLRPREPALLMMHNRAEMVEAQAALERLGGAAVSASWRSTPDELSYLVEHSGARAVLFEAELAPVVAAARHRWNAVPAANVIAVGGEVPGTTSYDSLVAMGACGPVTDAAGEDAAVVVYTSGTTGKPKGAVRRFPKTATLNLLQAMAELDLRADDRHLTVCPLYHSTAWAFASFTFGLGGTVVIERQFDPRRTLERMESERITTTAMVPTMLYRWLELPKEVRRRYDLRRLRMIFSGGAALSGSLARAFIEEYGHVLYNFYGATETGLNTLATPDELLRAPGTIGHLIAGNEIRILDDDGHPVPVGATGEIFVKNQMLVEYHRDQNATRGSMRDGFFSVGDLGHVDADGLYFIDGRKRDMIISGGVNVYPAEVEEVLAGHPAVGEAAVVGIADPEWGERVVAYVALREGARAEPEELTQHCRDRLSGPKVPRVIRVLPELPKNPTGKILKRELRALG